MSVQSMGEMGIGFCANVFQPFLESIDRRSCNVGSWVLIPVFHIRQRKCQPSPSVMARTLEYLVKNKFGSISKRPVNILKAVIRSARSRRCKGDEYQLPTLKLIFKLALHG